ncbi:USP8, partial [Symbiodinium sp. CCMP2456]
QRRWVVLKHGRLNTFQDEACLSPKAAFELNAGSKVVPFKAPGAPGQSVLYSRTRPFGFVLDLEPQAGKSRWMVYFDTLQPDELDRWTQAIEGSVQNLEARVQSSPGLSGHLAKQVPRMAAEKQGEDSA